MNGTEAKALLEQLGCIVARRAEITESELLAMVQLALGAPQPPPPQGRPIASSTERTRAYRQRKRERDAQKPESDVTGDVPGDAKERHPAEPRLPHTPSESVRSSGLSELKGRTEDPERAAGGVTGDASGDALRDGNSDVTVCPKGIAVAAFESGDLADLSEELEVPLDLLQAVAAEFEQYWRLGLKRHQRKQNWPGQLREHIRKGDWKGKVKPPGLLEHERFSETAGGPPPGWTPHPGIEGWWLDEHGASRRSLPGAPAVSKSRGETEERESGVMHVAAALRVGS